MCMRWVSVALTCICDMMCVCVFQTGLTFSCFKLTLPGVGGWRWRGQTEVICRSDPLSQLWHGTAELTGLRYPRPYLVFGFPPSLFFCTHGTIWYLSLCIQSDKYHEVGEEWAGRRRLCSRVIQWGAADWENGQIRKWIQNGINQEGIKSLWPIITIASLSLDLYYFCLLQYMTEWSYCSYTASHLKTF